MSMDKFEFVVARRSLSGSLNCYSAGGANIQHGSAVSANIFLKYVRDQRPTEQWDIYRLKYEKVIERIEVVHEKEE